MQKGDILLTVPISALRTAATVPKAITQALGDITVHGLLATDLALDKSEKRAAWRAVLPTRDDFKDSMPLMWDISLQKLLPPASKTLLENQQKKLKIDWATVSKSFPDLSYDHYLHNWLVVNTRTFYYVAHNSRKKSRPDDCMALNPFADYLNHSDGGCHVELIPSGFRITSDRSYDKGDEIYFSYGHHSNDFLLAEYGFIMPKNKWDELRLDHVIMPELSEENREVLKQAGFLGNYVLDRENICYRTQVALMLLCVPLRVWNRFVGGADHGESTQQQVDRLLLRLLNAYKEYALQMLQELSLLSLTFKEQRNTLITRWDQIMVLLDGAIIRIGHLRTDV